MTGPSDDSRVSRRWLIGGLIALHTTALPFGVWAVGDRRNGWQIETFAGLCFAQTSLLAVWLALGQRRWVARALAAALGITVASGALCAAVGSFSNGPEVPWVAFVINAPAALVAAVLFAVRRLGLVLGMYSGAGEQNGSRLRRQYGTRDLFLVTLLVALLLGGLQAARKNLSRANEFDLIVLLALYSAGITLASLWLILGRTRLRWRLFAVPATGLCLVGVYFLDPNSEVPKMLGGQLAFQTLTLLVLRACHFRLVAVDRERRSSPPGSAEIECAEGVVA